MYKGFTCLAVLTGIRLIMFDKLLQYAAASVCQGLLLSHSVIASNRGQFNNHEGSSIGHLKLLPVLHLQFAKLTEPDELLACVRY